MADRVGRGVYRVTVDGRSRLVYAVGPRHARWVFFEGQVACVDIDVQDAGPRAGVEDDALASPMPATVTAVHVAPGQHVKAGDRLVTLEAMKMELVITAPRAGVVSAVGCEVGHLVQAGVPVVTLA